MLTLHEPTDALKFMGHGTTALIARRILMGPMMYLYGLGIFAVQSSRPTFILGHAYAHGVWFYFPVLFVLKSTTAFLGLLIVALTTAAMAKRIGGKKFSAIQGMEFHWRAIWTNLVVFTGACVLSRLDISIRHFMVPIALMILMLAPLPRVLERMHETGWGIARWIAGLVAVLVLVSQAAVIRAYPYYIPFVNGLRFGRPAYSLVNDSNIDWNQALPQAEAFVRQHGLTRVLLDEYGLSDPTVFVPQAIFWDCQQAEASDAGQWAIVSAGMIEDGHNCMWLMQYEHQALAGGSMYAIHLPGTLPAAGEPGGPPLPSAYHNFGGWTTEQGDSRLIFLNCIGDPKQLQPTMDRMMAAYAAAAKK